MGGPCSSIFENVQTCGKVTRTVRERFHLEAPSEHVAPFALSLRSVCVGARVQRVPFIFACCLFDCHLL